MIMCQHPAHPIHIAAVVAFNNIYRIDLPGRIAELGIYKQLVPGEAAVFKILYPEEFFNYSIMEKFLAHVLVDRYPL